jgi:hypothetical protein
MNHDLNRNIDERAVYVLRVRNADEAQVNTDRRGGIYNYFSI